MIKIRFGTPETFVPSRFCKGFNYIEKAIKYDYKKIVFTKKPTGCILEFPLTADENIFGFGLQLQGFNHTKRKLNLRVNSDPNVYTGDSHAPVPFFVTTKGYGMYFDTAREIEVYCGFKKKRKRTSSIKNDNIVIDDFDELYLDRGDNDDSTMSVSINGAKGIDVYIFEGENITDIVSQYNMLSGGGCVIPDWGLGATYRAFVNSNQKDIEELAEYFKDEDIKINVIGLEPGWQTKSYSCSYVWDNKRYPDYVEMINKLKAYGYHVNLWEHGFIDCSSPLYEKMFDYSGDYEVWKGIVPDFSIREARDIFADYHKEHIVSLGIDGFKLDECDGSDFVSSDWSFPNVALFPGGMDGEQYHVMFGTLYIQTILQALGDVKTLSAVRNIGALASSYPFVLYSDLYNHSDFIRGIANAGFSGLLWTPEVRNAKNKKDFIRRLQTNVFSIQCLINAWYLDKPPWLKYDCAEETKELLNIRQSLIPMLKKAFEKYAKTGKPPIRALVSDYTHDPETYGIDNEYIFCDDLIVAPLTEESDTRDVYLPNGKWCDYWTGEEVKNGWFKVTAEEIPVYKKIQ